MASEIINTIWRHNSSMESVLTFVGTAIQKYLEYPATIIQCRTWTRISPLRSKSSFWTIEMTAKVVGRSGRRQQQIIVGHMRSDLAIGERIEEAARGGKDQRLIVNKGQGALRVCHLSRSELAHQSEDEIFCDETIQRFNNCACGGRLCCVSPPVAEISRLAAIESKSWFVLKNGARSMWLSATLTLRLLRRHSNRKLHTRAFMIP